MPRTIQGWVYFAVFIHGPQRLWQDVKHGALFSPLHFILAEGQDESALINFYSIIPYPFVLEFLGKRSVCFGDLDIRSGILICKVSCRLGKCKTLPIGKH